MTHPDAAALLEGTTPGPWNVLEFEWDGYKDVVQIICQDGEPVAHFYGLQAYPECVVCDPFQNDKANAALIAAAPDLAARVIELEAENARLLDLLTLARGTLNPDWRGHCNINAALHLINQALKEPTP